MLYLGAQHHLGLWPALGITVIVGGFCGGIIAALTLRCPPVLTAIVSLSISTVMVSWLLPRYERDSGIVTIPSLLSSGTRLFTASAIVAILVVVLLWGLRRSSWGTMVQSVRDTPTMANHFAISERRIRLSVWMLSGVIAALAGVLYSYFLLTITADAFGITLSISLLLYAVLGGTRSLLGPFIAPLGFVAGPQALHLSDTNSAQLVAIVSGLLVALVLGYRPDGVADIVGRIAVPGLSKVTPAWRKKPSARMAADALARRPSLVPARGYQSPASNGGEPRASAPLEARDLAVRLGGEQIRASV
jgi:branched-chain amino acid transport system permease protein